MEAVFLSREDVIYIQAEEAALTNSPTVLRDSGGLDSALAAPQASFDGDYLMNLFEMAATYITSISTNYPFMDGNKRTAAASALVFLSLNGYELMEEYEEELADQVLGFLEKRMNKVQLVDYLRKNSYHSPT